MAGKGRKPATGRFATREELEAYIRAEYHGSGKARTVPIIVRSAGVSAAVAQAILNAPHKAEG
jgi:hypothetical protein